MNTSREIQPPQWLSSKEAAHYLKITVRGLHLHRRRGDIHPTHIGGGWRYTVEQLDEFIEFRRGFVWGRRRRALTAPQDSR